jgi:hypothetical protein
VEVEQALAQVMNWSQGELVVAHASLGPTQALPGPTAATAHSSHDSVFGAASMKGWMNDATTGEMRTLAPTIVQVGSPKDVIPATRKPADVSYRAGPPESPSHEPF